MGHGAGLPGRIEPSSVTRSPGHAAPDTWQGVQVCQPPCSASRGLGAIMVDLRAAEGTGARCPEFAYLTSSRSGDARGASWTIPADRMKMKKEHCVPFCKPALSLLECLTRIAGNDLVLPAPRRGVLSDTTLTAVLRWLAVPVVPHGFRSTFRDWAATPRRAKSHCSSGRCPPRWNQITWRAGERQSVAPDGR